MWNIAIDPAIHQCRTVKEMYQTLIQDSNGLCCDCVVDDSINDEAVVSDVLPLVGTNITVGQVEVNLLIVVGENY